MQQDTRITKNSVALLYTDDKWTEKEIGKTSPFKMGKNSIKFLRVTLTEQVEDLYDKNFISLKKEIEGDTRKCKISHALEQVELAQ